MQSLSKHLFISVKDQTLEVREGARVLRTFPVSTSKFGLGSEESSCRTPVGRFRISEKIGQDAPAGTVFKGRVPCGHWKTGDKEEEDMILSRIMWLDGLDRENRNTHDRYVYIHGTNDEASIGKPVSHGCIRLRNADVIELFDLVPLGSPVEISETGKEGILSA